MRLSVSRTQLAVLTIALGMFRSLQADDKVWLVGGGFDLDNSQVQIEQNVLWARDVLQRLPGKRDLNLFFTDGDDPAPDVTQWQKPEETTDNLQPLARVYDTYYWNGESVRNHRVEGLRGPATSADVRAALRADLAALEPGDRGLLIYAGHGSPEGVLNLWDETRLDVDDLTAVLASQPPETQVRLVLTQCYAGGFHPAVMAPVRADPTAAVSRCGFYAVAAAQPAEGCTASLEVGDYRGYSTYFFAALAGKARDGSALVIDPDRDGDGRVDLFEAHLYTLRAARSMDLPRSSSEQYLLDWAPWYLPLVRVEAQTDNPYRPIAAALLADLGIAAPPDDARPAVHAHRKTVQMQIKRLVYRQTQARARAAGAREQIRYDLERRWPDVRYGHTRAYKRFLEQDLDAAQAYILNHPLYLDLVVDQDGYWVLDAAIIELQRRVAQLDRVDHLFHLARVRDAFAAWADADERAVHAGLLACERQPL